MANEIKKQNTPLALGTGTRLLSSESKSGTLSSTCCEAVRLLGAGQGCKAEEGEGTAGWRGGGADTHKWSGRALPRRGASRGGRQSHENNYRESRSGQP